MEITTLCGANSSADKDFLHMRQGTDQAMLSLAVLDMMKAHGTGVIGKMDTGTIKASIHIKALQTILPASPATNLLPLRT